jgi:hypothetical protein
VQFISHVERIFAFALVLLPPSSLNRAFAIDLRDSWRSWIYKNAHLKYSSTESKSSQKMCVNAEIQHTLVALEWKKELSHVQYATPHFSRDAYLILLETQPTSEDGQVLFSNMGGNRSR